MTSADRRGQPVPPIRNLPARQKEAVVAITPNALLVLLALHNAPLRRYVGKRKLAEAALREAMLRNRKHATVWHFVRAVEAVAAYSLVAETKKSKGHARDYDLMALGTAVLFGDVPVWIRRVGPYLGPYKHQFVEEGGSARSTWTVLEVED